MKAIKIIAVGCLFVSSFLAQRRSFAADADEKSAATTRKVEKAPQFTPAKPDGFMGDWQGDGGVVAQVYLLKGKYQANLLKAFDSEEPVIATLPATSAGDTLTFTGDGWTAAIKDSHFTGNKGDVHFDLQRVDHVSPTLGAVPPKDAIVLLDGHDLNAWSKKSGKDWLTEDGPARWKLNDDGSVDIIPGSDSIITHQKFGDCHLHVEFRSLGFPTKSAVFLEARYEVNVNETYGHLDGNVAGGLDNSLNSPVFHPKIRPALPPLAWQTFDIDFRALRFDGSNQKTEPARMTVVFNGIKIYDNQELNLPHGAAGRLGESPTGPVMLQDHLTPLQYRNIWIQPAK